MEGSPTRRILERLWCQAVDAISSEDFRLPDGRLDEAAYLRYEGNAIAAAERELQDVSERSRPV